MPIPTQLSTIFQSKQASYKMVLILSLIKSIDNTGKASLDKVVENFFQYYKDRQDNGRIIEKEDKVVTKLDSLTTRQIRSLILENPYRALSSVLIKEGTLPADEYIRFKTEIWAQLNEKSIQELKNYALDELEKYYASLSPTFSLHNALQQIMDNYLTSKNQTFARHELGQFVRREIPEGLAQLPYIDDRYKIQGSVGMGNWATIPWIAIMDKSETESTQQGVYVVYLFAEDMESVYLTLAQGVTKPKNEMGKQEGYNFMRENTTKMRDILPLEGMHKDENIKLSHQGLGSDYQVSTVAYYKYEKGNLPSDQQLSEDLRNVIDNYRIYLDQNESDSVHPEKRLEQMAVDEPTKQTIDYIKQYIAMKGFSFPDRLIENFYLSIKTKPFTILAGISGTGKTKLIQLFAEAIGAHLNDQYTLIPVRPDWSEPSDLLGYVDLQGEFREGPLTKVIIEASKLKNLNKPYLICLDEMNLARVEHYFSDFLSIMETRKWYFTEYGKKLIRTNPLLKLDQLSFNEQQLHIPENIYLIGTVNMDETTYPFSKKVLDRANTIEFNEVNLENYPEGFNATIQINTEADLPGYENDFLRSDYLTLQDAYTEDDQEYIHKVVQQLTKLNRILEQAHLHIGFRVRDELTFYMLYNRRFQLMNDYEAFDFQVMQKILPRIQGSSFMMKKILIDLYNQLANTNLSEKEDDLHIEMINRIDENSKYKRSLSKIAYMVRRYEEDGFTSFWIA
jgi:5-methylcytosine-specific restriction protein B